MSSFLLPDFHDIRHMKVVRSSAPRTGRLYPQECSCYSFLLGAESTPRAMVRSEGNMSLKNPVTPPGTDPGTVRLVAQRLNHYATPIVTNCWVQISYRKQPLIPPSHIVTFRIHSSPPAHNTSYIVCHKLFLSIPHPQLSKKGPINMGLKVNRFQDIHCCVEIREML
jgi:hypothetical protein